MVKIALSGEARNALGGLISSDDLSEFRWEILLHRSWDERIDHTHADQTRSARRPAYRALTR